MREVPIVTVTGWSNSGKTTFMTKVAGIISAAGVRVGVVKHHGHAPGGVDQEGKDSWKYAQAGANPVVLAASSQYAIFVSTPEREATRDELIAKIADDVDMVIVEGFRGAAEGAVEVNRVANGRGLKLEPHERIALITDNEEFAEQVRAEGKPVFGLEDHEAVAKYFCDLCGIEAEI